MRVALDTNILVYLAHIAKAPPDVAKIVLAHEQLERVSSVATIVVPVQAQGEMFTVLRRSGMAAEEARRSVGEVAANYESPATLPGTLVTALDLAVKHNLHLWDAIILCASSQAGCSLFLSEDMHDGFVALGITVVNPFAQPLHPKLAHLLA